jgi:hypothetical protein
VKHGYSELVVKMGVKFSFFAYGILAICALALKMYLKHFPSTVVRNEKLIIKDLSNQ